jgi:SAM-dependent methyltransferase
VQSTIERPERNAAIAESPRMNPNRDDPPNPVAARRAHWETAYREKPPEKLSWRQEEPALSLALIRELCGANEAVMDVGAGESALSARLVELGYTSIAAMDISPSAIDRARARAGSAAGRIKWIIADVLDAPALGGVRLWHDRAVFHFITEEADRRKYADLAARAVEPGGHAIIATFAPDGPERCSDLPVRRYDSAALAREFASAFELIRAERELHTTPWGKAQPFTVVALRRLRG